MLLALTKQDIKNDDELYPVLALSRGLLDRKEQQAYGRSRFSKIAHPDIRLFWGTVKGGFAGNRGLLRQALAAKEEAKKMAEWLGPDFDDFRKRLAE